MATVYNHISSNRAKTWIIVVLFPVCYSLLTYLVILGGHQIWLSLLSDYNFNEISQHVSPASPLFYYTNRMASKVIPLVAGLLVLWLLLAYWGGAGIMLNKVGATEITLDSDRRLYRLVENLCVIRGLPVPKIYVVPDKALNAFATGRNVENAVIVLTEGLLEALDKSELQGVIAHELAHIENRDITLMLLIIEGIAFFIFFGEIFLKSGDLGGFFLGNLGGWGGSGTHGGAVFGLIVILIISAIVTFIGLLLTLFGCVVAPILRFAMSRQREFLADATAALTTRNPGALIRALEKISQNSNTKILRRHPSMSAMCIDAPGDMQVSLFGRLSGLYASHPSIEERIKRLKQMDGQL